MKSLIASPAWQAWRATGYSTRMEQWTFLTNHAHVLLCVAADPQVRLCDVAARVGITERAAQRIVADLAAAGYLTRTRHGRRNRYEVHHDLPLRHPIERGNVIGALLGLVTDSGG